MKYEKKKPILKFPVLKEPLPGPPILTMDEYLEFVQFGWEHLIDHKANEEQKKLQLVDVPFRIISS